MRLPSKKIVGLFLFVTGVVVAVVVQFLKLRYNIIHPEMTTMQMWYWVINHYWLHTIYSVVATLTGAILMMLN